MSKKKVISCLSVVGIFVIIFGFSIFESESELLGSIQIFKRDKENKVVGTVVSSEETLNLKDIEEDIIVADIKEDVVIVEEPLVIQNESKKEITKTEIKNTESVKPEILTTTINKEKTENKEEIQNEFIKFEQNDKTIAAMQAKIFTMVPREWLFSGSKVIIDSTGIDETTEYVTIENLNKDLLRNKSGDIKIYAYDEIWNNGTDYVLRTRCYIR